MICNHARTNIYLFDQNIIYKRDVRQSYKERKLILYENMNFVYYYYYYLRS